MYHASVEKTLVYQWEGAVSLATALTRMCKEQLTWKACACDVWEGDTEEEYMVISTEIRQDSACRKPLGVSDSAVS